MSIRACPSYISSAGCTQRSSCFQFSGGTAREEIAGYERRDNRVSLKGDAASRLLTKGV